MPSSVRTPPVACSITARFNAGDNSAVAASNFALKSEPYFNVAANTSVASIAFRCSSMSCFLFLPVISEIRVNSSAILAADSTSSCLDFSSV